MTNETAPSSDEVEREICSMRKTIAVAGKHPLYYYTNNEENKMTRCCPVCKTEDVLWNSLEDKFCICLKCDATGVSVERAKPCTVKVTRAEPAAPSSDEVEDAFAYITPHPENHSAISLSANKLRGYVNTLHAHIAALEAEVELQKDLRQHSQDITDRSLAQMRYYETLAAKSAAKLYSLQEGDKRLREALSSALAWL